MRGFIQFLWLKLYVSDFSSIPVLSCLLFCSLSKGWILVSIRNVECSNFKHERLNKISLIKSLYMSLLTSCCYLSNGWMSITIRNVNHFNFMHKRLNKNKSVDCFNFYHERLNQNYLIIALFLSYLDFFFVL